MELLRKIKVWPFTHLCELLTFKGDTKINDVAKPYVTDPCILVVKMMAMIPLCLITWICFQIDPLEVQMREAFAIGTWVLRIVVRDLVLLALLGGGW